MIKQQACIHPRTVEIVPQQCVKHIWVERIHRDWFKNLQGHGKFTLLQRTVMHRNSPRKSGKFDGPCVHLFSYYSFC